MTTIEARPHRVASFTPPETEIQVVPAAMLESLAAEAPQKQKPHDKNGHHKAARNDVVERCWRYVEKCPDAISGNHGHDAALRVACECYRFGLDDYQARGIMERFSRLKSGNEEWSEKEIEHKLADGRKKVEAAVEFGCRVREDRRESERPHERNGKPESKPSSIMPVSIGDLRRQFPELRLPIVDGLLRRGEVFNFIAGTKFGKSWTMYDLGLSIVTGGKWLGRFDCERGKVLLVDNELHAETIAHRIPRVAEELNVAPEDYETRFDVIYLRGRLRPIFALRETFERIGRGQYSLVILDAQYRMLPDGTSENDNSMMAAVYNCIDEFAETTDAAFGIVHHSSKGDQSGKAVTDVGAGAGSQSRACDTHLVMRPHEEEQCGVLEAAVRSWQPVPAIPLRWDFPIWRRDGSIDPGRLKGMDRNREKQTARDKEGVAKIEKALGAGPAAEGTIRARASMGKDRCEKLLFQMEEAGRIATEFTTIRGKETCIYRLK